MAGPSLVNAIYEDRKPRGATRDWARSRADEYEEWLEELAAGRASRRYDPDAVYRFLDSAVQRVARMAAVYGPQEKGKTNLCAVATELILSCRQEWEVYSNVPYPWNSGAGKAPPRLHLVESLSEILEALSTRILDDKADGALILDEFDQEDTSHSWASESSESWSKFVNIKRHYQARGPLTVFHALHLIPLGIRSGATGSAYKLVSRGGEHALVDLEDPAEWVATIPRATLPHLSYGLRGFSLDVDVQALQERFVGTKFRGDRRAVAEVTLDFLGEQREIKEELRRSGEVLEQYGDALAIRKRDLAAGHEALVERDRRIMLDIEAGIPRRQITERYRTSATHVSKLNARLAGLAGPRSPVPGVSAPRTREGSRAGRPGGA